MPLHQIVQNQTSYHVTKTSDLGRVDAQGRISKT